METHRAAVRLIAAAALAAGLAGLAAAGEPAKATCTFTNPGYAGSCVEEVDRAADQSPADACRPVLDCLNNAQCTGSYCHATTIRGGWTLKSAE